MQTFLPPPDDLDAAAFVRAMAPAIGLALDPAEVAEVAANLSRTAGFAALLGRVSGIDATEAAPVFRAQGHAP